MHFQLIRNATCLLEYGGLKILIDPMFAPQGVSAPLAGIARNPTVDLPLPVNEIIDDLDLVIISHLHPDHFDPFAQQMLDKELPILVQPEDAEQVASYGFKNVRIVRDSVTIAGITIERTAGQHGYGQVAQELGPVSGFYFRAAAEPSVYWLGDTVWTTEAAAVVASRAPEVVICHAGGAVWADGTKIIMDGAQTIALCQAAPESTVVATHMEALDLCLLSRQSLRDKAAAAGISPTQLLIPNDGERLEFMAQEAVPHG